jgi:hypothetical protein
MNGLCQAVVLGAAAAGLTAAETLRRERFSAESRWWVPNRTRPMTAHHCPNRFGPALGIRSTPCCGKRLFCQVPGLVETEFSRLGGLPGELGVVVEDLALDGVGSCPARREGGGGTSLCQDARDEVA